MIRALFHTRAAATAASTGVGAGVASFAVMHVTQSDAVDPVATPVSSYALTFPGLILFPFGVLGLALACAVLSGRGVGLPRQGLIRILLAAAALALVGAVAFPTGTPESGLTVGAQIHRYSAGAAFVLLTAVGGLAAARTRSVPLVPGLRRAMLWATAVSAAMFLTTTVNTFLPELADGGQWRGIPQRALLVTLSVLIWALIANSARAAEAASALEARPATVTDAARTPALAGSTS